MRVRVTGRSRDLPPAAGTTIEVKLRGTPLSWTVEATDDPEVVALAPVADDREAFYAVVETARVLRVSRELSGSLWLD